MTQLELEIQETKNSELKSSFVITKLSRRQKGIIAVALLLTAIGLLIYWLSDSLLLGTLAGVVPFISYKIGKWISEILKQDYDYSKPMF
jgi:predicted PurR-regulated permease PerM